MGNGGPYLNLFLLYKNQNIYIYIFRLDFGEVLNPAQDCVDYI